MASFFKIDAEKLKEELVKAGGLPLRGAYITRLVSSMLTGDELPEWAAPVEKALQKGKQGAYTQEFETFWAAYPTRNGVKSGKAVAFRAWCRQLKAKPVLLSACLTSLAWQKETEQWRDSGGKYVPMATTYLNQLRFDDEQPTESGDWYIDQDGIKRQR